jgi:hypothetical protein
LLDKQDAAKKIGLYVEPIKAAHIPRRIDAAKMYGGHGQILPAAIQLCTRFFAMIAAAESHCKTSTFCTSGSCATTWLSALCSFSFESRDMMFSSLGC